MIANYKVARATKLATEYAAKSLRDDQERFRVGMATTHELLQYQDALIAAQGNEVPAEVDYETAKLTSNTPRALCCGLQRELSSAQAPDVKPWYAQF